VLVVVRTPVALNRLLDVLPVVAEDARVQLVFTVDPESRFSSGLEQRLTAAGARMTAWDHALASRFDLVLAASDNSPLHRFRGPLVLLPHGAGYQRYAPREPGAVSGLRRSTLVRGKRMVPSTLVVAHPSQLDVVSAVEPRLLPRTVVAGDPCLDRMSASMRWRDRYRAAFDATGRRLVVLCSTWGRHSAFGRHPDLPTRLTGALDTDRNRVALVLHPNIWAWHGPLQIRAWLRPAIDAGLIVVPPDEDWRGAVIASDVVLSDHGSLTCYAAATGRPVLMVTDGGPEVVPGSPIDVLRRQLPTLRVDEPLDQQMPTAQTSDVTELMFAHRGQAADLLRAEFYRTMRLAPPTRPVRHTPLPVPTPSRTEPTAYAVLAAPERVGEQLHVVLQRFPAINYEETAARRHLATDESEVDPRWLERAAVVWRSTPHTTDTAARAWAEETLRRWPAARVAVTGVTAGALALCRDHGEVRTSGPAEPALIGSALHACLRASIPIDAPTLRITAGPAPLTVRRR
jgi:hypothetical protein